MASLETQILLSLNEMEFSTQEQLTLEEIKKRHHYLAKKFHPDLNGDEVFEKKQYKTKI